MWVRLGLLDVFRAYLGTLWDCLGLAEGSLWVSRGSLYALSLQSQLFGVTFRLLRESFGASRTPLGPILGLWDNLVGSSHQCSLGRSHTG